MQIYALVHYFPIEMGISFESTKYNIMNHIASKQSIQSLPITLNLTGEPEVKEPVFKAYRNIDLVDVYHVTNCTFFPEIKDPKRSDRRMYSVGEFFHPSLMIGMPCIGGSVKLHIDTRFEGYYVLWSGTKLDSWAVGPSMRFWDVVTWTPKVSGDNIQKAAYRLAKAMFLQMDFVSPGEWTTDMYQNEDWESEWYGTGYLMDILREIRNK